MASRRTNSRSVPYGAGVCLALLAVSSLCRADGPAVAVPGAVTPNQSVSLGAEEAIMQSDERAEGSAGKAEPKSPVDAKAAAGSVSPGASEPSTFLRRREAPLAFGQSPDEAVPWYRTGFGALGVVLGFVIAAFWALRRWVPSMRVRDGGMVKVVGRAAISPRHNVALLHFGRRFVLVGIAGDRLSALAEVSDADEVAELVARVGGTSGFDEWLGRESTAFEKEWGEEAADTVDNKKFVHRARRASMHGSALTKLKNRLRSLQSE